MLFLKHGIPKTFVKSELVDDIAILAGEVEKWKFCNSLHGKIIAQVPNVIQFFILGSAAYYVLSQNYWKRFHTVALSPRKAM